MPYMIRVPLERVITFVIRTLSVVESNNTVTERKRGEGGERDFEIIHSKGTLLRVPKVSCRMSEDELPVLSAVEQDSIQFETPGMIRAYSR